MQFMTTNITINKPLPIAIGKKIKEFTKDSDVKTTITDLKNGNSILITEFYKDGISLLQELHKNLKFSFANTTFKEQQEYRKEYQRLSNLIYLEIVDQKIAVKKAPYIGWLERFYPENTHFLLTLPQIQGMNSAWQWYKNGISIPVLRNKVHPYYGTYFPTRFEHLSLFDNWLKRYKGAKKTAIEVGVGCGVLSLQLLQHQFQKVYATDINPNAIVGLQEFMGTTKLSRKLELDLGHLFGKWDKQTELIVFNPPWLPTTQEAGGMDDAIYYNEALFEEFFAEAKKRLLPEGKLLLIFSNLAQITNMASTHPIETEITKGNRFKLERCFKKSVGAASDKTTRKQHWRATEEVELWILNHC
jgi:hypothetical protein